MQLSLGLSLSSVAARGQGGGVPAGYTFLRGKNADTSYSILRGQLSTGVYVNLIGKVA